MSNIFQTNDFDSKPAAARAVGVLFGGALLILSAITTAAFFFAYAPHMFDFISPSLSPYLSALSGVLCFEAASVAWSWLRAHDSDTAGQLAVANVGAWGSMIGGLAVTSAYFALQTDLITPRLDDAMIMTVSILGGVLIIVGIGGNFCLGFIYRNMAAGHMEAANNAELRAMRSQARHLAQSETTKATLARSLAEIRKGLPEHAQRQGQANAGQYLAENFTQGSPGGDKWGIRLVDLAENGNGTTARPTKG